MNSSSKRLAVTGGIAEGKSTVVGYLRNMGIRVVSADETAKDVLSDPRLQDKISVALGLPVPLNRDILRERVSNEPKLRRKVNSILHPEIVAKLLADPAPVAEVPLLVETCLLSSFDSVWVVTCGSAEQLKRLTERLGNADLARNLIQSQLSTTIKIAFADHVIRTDQPPNSVKCLVESLARDSGLA